jgi:hypothetical protein
MTCKYKDGQVVFGVHSWDLLDALLPPCIQGFMEEDYLEKNDWAIRRDWPMAESGALLAAVCSKWNFEVELEQTPDEYIPRPTERQQLFLKTLDDALVLMDPAKVQDLVDLVAIFSAS